MIKIIRLQWVDPAADGQRSFEMAKGVRKTIGTNLRERRIKLGYSITEVAEGIGINRQKLSNWELDKNYPDCMSIYEIAKFLRTTVEKLMEGDDE